MAVQGFEPPMEPQTPPTESNDDKDKKSENPVTYSRTTGSAFLPPIGKSWRNVAPKWQRYGHTSRTLSLVRSERIPSGPGRPTIASGLGFLFAASWVTVNIRGVFV